LVTPKQAERLSLASHHTTIRMVLGNPPFETFRKLRGLAPPAVRTSPFGSSAPVNRLLRTICAATSATASVPSLPGGGRPASSEKNRPDVIIRGIWFARRSIQDAAGCLNQELRMSVRIRLRRERDRLQQRTARRDRIDGLPSRIGDPQIAIRCRQHPAAPGLRIAPAIALINLPEDARRAELKNHLKADAARAAGRDTVQEAIWPLRQNPVRGGRPIGPQGKAERRGSERRPSGCWGSK